MCDFKSIITKDIFFLILLYYPNPFVPDSNITKKFLVQIFFKIDFNVSECYKNL